jgi:hypothetical protein
MNPITPVPRSTIRPDYLYFLARREELAARVKRLAGKEGVNVALGQLQEVVRLIGQIETMESK